MAVSASGRRAGVCLFSLSENLPLMTLIYADTSLLVSRYFFAFAHTFNHCHLERESKDPEYASLLNADSRRSHENVSRELPVTRLYQAFTMEIQTQFEGEKPTSKKKAPHQEENPSPSQEN